MRPNLAPCRPVSARVALIAALALTTLTASGCVGVPTKTVTITRTIEQTGAVIAPTAPKGGGAPLRPGQVALEGGFSFTAPTDADRTRYQDNNRTDGGPSGNTYNDKSLHGRVALSPAHFIELGFGFDYAHTAWGTASAASDARATDIEGFDSFWSVTPHLLIMPYRGEHSGFGFNFETDLTQIAHRRDVYEKAYETTYTGILESKTEYLGRRITSKTRANIYPIFRFGLLGFGHIGDLTLAGGAAVQNMPVFFGAKRADFQCTYYDALNDPDGQPDYLTCQGVEDTDDIDPYDSTAVYTLHFSAAYTIGGLTLQAQVATHLSGNQAYQILPFRADLTLRYAFDVFKTGPSEMEIRRLYNTPNGDGPRIDPNNPNTLPLNP